MRRLLLIAALAAGLAACTGSGAPEPAGPSADDNLAAAANFLASNAKAPGVITLPSGLEYKVLASGPAGGTSPGVSDLVSVAYEGRLLNGKVFDARGSDHPATFVVGQLIPAWTEALQHMKPGDVWMLYAPPNLAYGADGNEAIPANSALVFKVQLVAVLSHPE